MKRPAICHKCVGTLSVAMQFMNTEELPTTAESDVSCGFAEHANTKSNTVRIAPSNLDGIGMCDVCLAGAMAGQLENDESTSLRTCSFCGNLGLGGKVIQRFPIDGTMALAMVFAMPVLGFAIYVLSAT